MAVLLAWMQWTGRLEASTWLRLREKAAERVRYRGQEIALPHGRVFRAPQRPGEAQGLHAEVRTATSGAGAWAVDGELGNDPALWPSLAVDGGPHASIWMALDRPLMVLRRDVLGRRLLAYARVPGGMVVASGEGIVAAHPGVSSDLDDEGVAACLAITAPPRGRSLCRDIRIVEPGETLVIGADGERSSRQRIEPDPGWRRMPDEEIVELTRVRVRSAVRRGCAGGARIGVLLSAGLDSSSVAALAHHLGHRPVALTHGFRRFPTCDERPEVGAWVAAAGIEARTFEADDAGLVGDGMAPVCCADGPWSVAIRSLRDVGHAAAAAAGVDVCLDGDFSDYLEADPLDALADAVRFGRTAVVRQSAIRILRNHGARTLLLHPAWRRLASRALGRVGHWPLLIDLLAARPRQHLLERLRAELAEFREFPRPEQAYYCLRLYPAWSAAREQLHAQRHGIEHRSPLHDPALTRWMLSLPADLSYREGHGKWLLRRAMAGLLPEGIRWRPKAYSLEPFLEARATAERHRIDQLVRLVHSRWAPLMAAPLPDPGRPSSALHLHLARIGAWMEARDRGR